MKTIILTIATVSLLFLGGCGAEAERGKLCKFLHTCDDTNE